MLNLVGLDDLTIIVVLKTPRRAGTLLGENYQEIAAVLPIHASFIAEDGRDQWSW